MRKSPKILSTVIASLVCSLLKKSGCFFALVLCCLYSNAHHIRTGEITYRHVSGYTYEFTVTMFYSSASIAWQARTNLQISWGDNQKDFAHRISSDDLPDNITKCVYQIQKTFPGQGVYTVVLEDVVARNFGVLNISGYQPFSIKTIIRIDPNIGHRHSPQFNEYPLVNATAWESLVYNSLAVAAGNDSLTYELVVPIGERGNEIETYSLPHASKELYIDRVTGDLVWDTPTVTGDYVVAIRINKWLRGVVVSRVTREISITVHQNEGIIMSADIPVPEKTTVNIYPNPADEIINFRLEKESIVQIFDVSGKLLLSQKRPAGNVVMDISHLTAGVYILKIENRAAKFVKRDSM